MARRIDGWQADAAGPPANAVPTPESSAATADAVDRLAMAERAVCDCPDYRRDKVCDHVLMAAAVRMVKRMIDAHSDSAKSH